MARFEGFPPGGGAIPEDGGPGGPAGGPGGPPAGDAGTPEVEAPTGMDGYPEPEVAGSPGSPGPSGPCGSILVTTAGTVLATTASPKEDCPDLSSFSA
jgi:hypothetical protein